MAIGTWDTNTNIMNVPYYTDIKILGFHMANTVKQSAHDTWPHMTATVRTQAHGAYCRDLCLSQGIQYVHIFLLARAWYTAQMFPAPDECIRRLNPAIAWYLWHGETFRFPLSTLHRPQELGEGGWGLIDVAAKSRALLIDRLRSQSQKQRTITAAWLQRWDLLTPSKKPPHIERIPKNLEYLRSIATDTAYIVPPGQEETPKAYKRRIYDTMRILLQAEPEPQMMRIVMLWATTDWGSVWKNLHTAPVSAGIRSVWFRVIHDIIPTRGRLHKIRFTPTDQCQHCGEHDSLQHRLTECGDWIVTWEWTKKRLALMLRSDPKWISTEWLLRPQFKLWPPQRHRAILWTLANPVLYRMQQQRNLTLHDFLVFPRRAKWKI
jgi:hypothetical protein